MVVLLLLLLLLLLLVVVVVVVVVVSLLCQDFEINLSVILCSFVLISRRK